MAPTSPADDHGTDASDLRRALDAVAHAASFSGVVRAELAGEVLVDAAYGFAHRACGVANRTDTRFGLASGGKGLTALAVMRLCEDGVLGLDTSARSLLGADLPLVDDAVTIEHLLAHRSGIGDFLPEHEGMDIAAYVLPVPVHRLVDTEDYLPVLDHHPQEFEPGSRFSYCNGGFVLLALLAERASGTPYATLVAEQVTGPAGMGETAFLRSDDLPGDAALGYLDDTGDRTNVLHLPVCGSGDGGVYSTTADISRLWRALFVGDIVRADTVATMVRPHSDVPSEEMRYGLGFWLHAAQDDVVMLEGYDAGASFRSVHDPVRELTHTVIGNTSEGAWPVSRFLHARFGTTWPSRAAEVTPSA